MKNLLWIVSFFVLSSCGASKLKKYQLSYSTPAIQIISDSIRVSENSFLVQNPYQLWEMKVQGSPLELGLRQGILYDTLMHYQERVLFQKINDFIPSERRQRWLKKFLSWYNRKLPQHISEYQKQEIYGLAQFASNEFDFIGPKYPRSLYLHAAHDIGHALQDLMLVGCSSFAVWDEHSEDGGLLIGRNFDFYLSDAFAQNKVVNVVQPDSGHAFISVTWPGMIGVVSGMNEHGLTVSINAGKSSIPLKAKTPIALLAREILQFAQNTEEAIAIAKQKKVFVSESILVGSAEENKAIIIELSPKKIGIKPAENSSRLICSNHFQSASFKKDKRNNKQVRESHSQYRWDKMNELISANPPLNPNLATHILRNTQGLENKEIGFGNEKALNQLLAHHGVIFQPQKRRMWVSANPYVLGEFVAYDLAEILGKSEIHPFYSKENTLPADPFLKTVSYKNYEKFRIWCRKMEESLKNKSKLEHSWIEDYIALNPEYWLVYYQVGKYYQSQKELERAKTYFRMALSKEVTTLPAKKKIEKNL